jgi:hypothetical protein
MGGRHMKSNQMKKKHPWYADANDVQNPTDDAKIRERPYYVYRIPVNFFYCNSPFALHETHAEDVQESCEEHSFAKSTVMGK